MLCVEAIYCSNFSKEPGSIGDDICICKYFLLQKKPPNPIAKDIFHCLTKTLFEGPSLQKPIKVGVKVILDIQCSSKLKGDGRIVL